MTTARLFVVEWNDDADCHGGSFPIMCAPDATPESIREDAVIQLEASGWVGAIKSITEYRAVSTDALQVRTFRTRHDYNGSMHVYHMEIIHEGKGTGKWIVISAENSLEIQPNRPVFIEFPEGI